MLLYYGGELNTFIDSRWVDEASTEQGVVPIEDDSSFVELGFFLGSEPYLLISKLAEKVLPDIVPSPYLLNVIQGEPVRLFSLE
jgi:hypothetical protein